MLTQKEKNNILDDFPNIKLSYENIIHKKVFNADMILAIPKGTKCFAWFTMVNDNYECVILELDSHKKQIKDIKLGTTCFSTSLCYGTIVYGTLFNYTDNMFFSVEDMFLYKGNEVFRENWQNKLAKISSMFTYDLNQNSYGKRFIVFGLPLMSKTNDEMEKLLGNSVIPYKVEYIQYIHFNKTNSYYAIQIKDFLLKEDRHKTGALSQVKDTQNKVENLSKTRNNHSQTIIFKVRPDIQNDIYHLYCSEDEYYGIACIPDFELSVVMNKLFRNIKENGNLDKLEESDDEEEFENPNVDKFVYSEKTYYFECIFHKRFKKWIPHKLLNNHVQASKLEEVQNAVNRFNFKPKHFTNNRYNK